jgi:hypothetical protein
MSATSASAPSTTAHVATNSRLRRLGLRATGATLQLATRIVGRAGMAWASPEMGC